MTFTQKEKRSKHGFKTNGRKYTMTKRIVETTTDGWTMLVRAQVIYQNDSGQFVSREDYVENRDGNGYGDGGYGQ